MHVLTRGVDQGVVIGDNTEVTVMEIGPDFVRVAIESPDLDPPYRERTLRVEPKEPELPEAIRNRFRY